MTSPPAERAAVPGAAGPAAGSVPAGPVAGSDEVSRLRVLVVDDEPFNVTLLERMLARDGFTDVHCVTDSREAAARYAALRPDLVLLDLMMPYVDGFDLLAAFAGVTGSDDYVPVLVLTADTGAETRHRALASGAHDFLLKPFDLTEALQRIRNLGFARALHVRNRRHAESLEALVAERTRALQRERRFLRALVDCLQEGVVACDADGTVALSNVAARALGRPALVLDTVIETGGTDVATAPSPGRFYLADLSAPLRPESHPLLRALGGERVTGQELAVVDEGEVQFVVANGRPIVDESGDQLGAVVALHDITARRRVEDELRRRAFHDALTDLPNRALFLDRLDHALAKLGRGDGGLAVLSVDLDHFKLVNDSWGHSAGDEVLLALADRLRNAVRPGDTAGRLGGDEFAVLAEGLPDGAGAGDLAQRVRRALAEPILVLGHEVRTEVSVGITVAADAARSAEELLRDADAAMFHAKQQGGGRQEVFTERIRVELLRRLDVERSLRDAVAGGELRLHYQPLVDLRAGRIVGLEALLRWQRPGVGLVPPGDFVPVAERSALIGELGAWALTSACRQLAEWEAAVAPAVSVSVNISARQLDDPRLAEQVRAVLEDTGVPPSRLCLEITETAVMRDVQAAKAVLDALRAVGVTLAIDDFGTGHSSLAYLRRLPIDVLKIDRAFVEGLGEDPEDGAIVATVVALARELGRRACAEGVETPEQLRELIRLGCPLAQGYLFSRPVPAPDVPVLAAHRWDVGS